MKIDELKEIMDKKILDLFYKLIELVPIEVKYSRDRKYLIGEDKIELCIGAKSNDSGYKFPDSEEYRPCFSLFTVTFVDYMSDDISFYINLPNGRQVRVPNFEKEEIWKIKATLLEKQKEFELKMLDKYL